jgi:type 1 glutamine amidotransferase
MYFVKVDASETTRLLEVMSPDYGRSSAAWAHSMGTGRVFCFTPGHRNEVLEDPGYRRLLVGYMLEEKMTTAVKEGGGPGEGD